MGFLAREYPELVEQYGHLYAGKYAPAPYLQRVQDVVGMLKARYGLPLGKAKGRRQKAEENSVASPTRASV